MKIQPIQSLAMLLMLAGSGITLSNILLRTLPLVRSLGHARNTLLSNDAQTNVLLEPLQWTDATPMLLVVVGLLILLVIPKTRRMTVEHP
jgi:hypothetical protein